MTAGAGAAGATGNAGSVGAGAMIGGAGTSGVAGAMGGPALGGSSAASGGSMASGGSTAGTGTEAGNGGASPCAGMGSGTVPAPLCKGTTLTYYALDPCANPIAKEHFCTNGCVFASTTSAKCGGDTEPPFRTCVTSADCGTEKYCATPTKLKLLDGGTCMNGVCGWQTTVDETCTLACFAASCQGQGGSTSGSFPWAMPATCNGNVIKFYYGLQNGGGPYAATYTCEGPCYTDAHGVGCAQQAGEPPFHSCMKATDCPNPAARCDPQSPSTIEQQLQPECPNGACRWLGKETLPCPSGTSCNVDSCN